MPKIHVIDSEGEEHTVEGQVGLSLMESLRDLDNGVSHCAEACALVRHVIVILRNHGQPN